MNLYETYKSAWWSLMSNKLRSFLSMLGIIIGVASVVAVVSIGIGAQREVLARVSALGSNLIMINPASTAARGGSLAAEVTELFTLDLAREIQSVAPDVIQVAPQVQMNTTLIAGDTNLNARLVGVTAGYREVTNYQVRQGRFIHELDVEHANAVIVLGSRVASQLYGSIEPVGREITVASGSRRYTFTVIGVMEAKGQVQGNNYDAQVYVPISLAMDRLLRIRTVSSIFAQASSTERAPEAVAQIEFFLSSRLGHTEGFRITSQDEMLETMGEVARTLRFMLTAIGSIALVVGGIGVMNIMLVSVAERTTEIGTRKALGAKPRDLLLQFLVESLILSITGGLFGMGIGTLLARGASRLGGWPVEVAISSLVLAFTFSALVGIIAGVYPAMKAARLDPVTALSYE